MNGYDDDDGQVDGDGVSPASPFARSMGEQPWLRGSQPPWHMWGNTQRVVSTLASGIFAEQQHGQLVRVAYARPETWHWLMAARLVSGSAAPLGTTLQLTIAWDLTIGIGRAMWQRRNFDFFNFLWTNSAAPADITRYATQTTSVPNREAALGPPFVQSPVTEIVAQDIQLNARASLSLTGAAVGYPYDIDVELTAFFAPKTHVRPDWYRAGPQELKFPGSEVAGR